MLKALTQKPLLGAIGSVVVVLVLLGLWKIPQWQVAPLQKQIDALQTSAKPADPEKIAPLEKSRLDAENASRTVLVQGVGGLLVFATIFISWRNLKATQEKQVADRFSKAVEQLGSENTHARLGGIYALEQIAKDAEEKYYWQVMETLTSYVRERSPWPPKAIKTHSSFVQTALETIANNETQSDEEIPPLAIDIQAVMTVIARRKYAYGHLLEQHSLDLHGTDLRRLQLPPYTQLNAHLNQANLAGANFAGVNFSGANLQEASLRKINLQKANLETANLQKASLWKASLQGAFLLKANLQKANLNIANLQQAFLSEVNLQEANLETANLQGVSLGAANLQQTNFLAANLQGAYLNKADLRRADLREANLQEADFREANLQGAEFKFPPSKDEESEDEGFKAEAIGLTWEQLNEAASYEGAILPDYLSPRSPQVEMTQFATQATESVQAEGEVE